MGTGPIFNYKTTTIGGIPSAQTTGKTTATGSSGASGTSSTDSYMGKLEAEGYKKQGKTPPPGDSQTGDPVADLLNTLDKVSNEGVPQGNMVPFLKITAEDALSKYPDAPQDILEKFKSIVGILQTKIGDLDSGLSSGTGTPQQVQAAQQLKAQLEDLLSFYTIQRDKVAEIIPQKEKFWADELKAFQQNGGSGDPRNFDLDGKGWLGKPNAKGSYRIGMRTFDKAYIDLEAKKLHDAGATDVQYKFGKNDVQYWAIHPETEKRVQFDPKTKKVVGDQVAAPGYTASMGTGFAGENASINLNEKGEMTLKAKSLSGSGFAEAGLELHTPEYIYVKVDSNGEIETDDEGRMQPAPFELKDGGLTQKTLSVEEQAGYKQVYVKEMKVSTESTDNTAGGNIVVELRGGDDNAKILKMHITGPDSNTKASDVALAITSGKGSSHRETPIVLNAGGYESTSKVGIQDPKNFYDKLDYDGPQKKQINDTLKHFIAKGDGKIDSLLSRGIAFQTRGHITGTSGNDLFVIEPPQDHLTVLDGAYATVINGQGGHNAVFGRDVGSVFATGMTIASIENTEESEISIGINAYGEKKDPVTKNIETTTGGESNKLYIHVKAPSSKVAVQSANDGKLNAFTDKGSGNPAKDAWTAGDDYYDVTANEIGTNAMDGNNPSQPFDLDLQTQNAGTKNERKPLKGAISFSPTGDFQIGGGVLKERIKALDDSIKKKATEKDEDWKIEGTTHSWMQGKYYKKDKNTLEQFFSDFSVSKVNALDPFKQLDKGIEQASGEDD